MRRLKISILCLAMVLVGIFFTPPSVRTDSSDLPRLENGGVTPENGWGDTNFTFKVIYLSPENVPLADNYPKLYLDGVDMPMKEADTSDKNFTDGKLYVKTWSPGYESLGVHVFSFRARDISGEVIDYPKNGTFEGPIVRGGAEVDLLLEKESGKLIFSGRLKLMGENVVREGIHIYRIFSDENRLIGSVQTSENGSFSLVTDIPEGHGISRYRAVFPGGEIYGKAESDSVYFNSFDFVYTLLIPLLALIAILISAGYLMNRSYDLRSHLTLLILGALVGWLLFQFFALWGVLIGGGIIGYFLSREMDEWTDWLKFGFMGGLIGFSLSVSMILSSILALPEIIGPGSGLLLFYSITQGDFLFSLLLISIRLLVLFVILIALGTLIGGYLRKFLK